MEQGDIELSNAIKILQGVFGSRKHAERRFSDAARSGKISCTYEQCDLEISVGPVARHQALSSPVFESKGPGVLGPTSWLQGDNTHCGHVFWYWSEDAVAVDSGLEALRVAKGRDPYILPSKRRVWRGVKTFTDQLEQLIASGRAQYRIHKINPGARNEGKWSRLLDIEEEALHGKLGDRLGSPNARGFMAALVAAISDRYRDDDGWPSESTIKRHARKLARQNLAAVTKGQTSEVTQTEP